MTSNQFDIIFLTVLSIGMFISAVVIILFTDKVPNLFITSGIILGVGALIIKAIDRS